MKADSDKQTDPIRVIIIDDHPMFRQGVRHSLGSDPGIQVVGEGANADDALQLTQELLPDVLLLDISMPGGGLNAANRVTEACPVVRIGMLTVSDSDDDVMQALKAGAGGYIEQSVADRDGAIGSNLTAREEQILKLIAHGVSNREIGDALNIAEKTVKNYVTNVFQKLQVRIRVEAAIVAR